MGQHILVVDDDGDARNILIDILADNGFIATAVSGGAAMRAVLSDDGIPIDAIVLDARMPGETSTALALYAKSLRLPVVMISGSHEAMGFAEDMELQLLLKPFKTAALLGALKEALSSGEFGQRGASAALTDSRRRSGKKRA